MIHSFLAFTSSVVQGLLALLSGIRNDAFDVCLGVAECCRSFGGKIILKGTGRIRST
jgi:hypothetical protein